MHGAMQAHLTISTVLRGSVTPHKLLSITLRTVKSFCLAFTPPNLIKFVAFKRKKFENLAIVEIRSLIRAANLFKKFTENRKTSRN